jgi:isoquinoline 1-oxidoreductase alpha subunit
MAISLTVNNQAYQVEVAPETPLLWVIRDVVGLKGTKFGCGIGQCGACTVHVRGRAVRSCQTQVQAVGDGAVTTLEGLSTDGTHPVQIAWQQADVPQCGYCQAGQMMSAAALLATIAKPSDADIDKAMNGNICRCGTYLRIRDAIHKAAALGSAPRATGSSASAAPAASREREQAGAR